MNKMLFNELVFSVHVELSQRKNQNSDARIPQDNPTPHTLFDRRFPNQRVRERMSFKGRGRGVFRSRRPPNEGCYGSRFCHY